ncbi:hypothetical protein [Mucilaginibacter ginsenosidivorans]|uniref:Uncharacterized protein n=1 Tax=Mucilaginibacter ginsenosidivorans TaxID=398053 RepID=A0A5B8UUX1_9SPHI|nr:hypothetical protein [Mucilaginibacter ginsenosidivorans]QEC62733.1 hypothetical protein FRZ54_09085 [Mucilaginibacter ginsenosidivorans]
MKLLLISAFILIIGSARPPAGLQGTYGVQSRNDKAPYSLLQIHYSAKGIILFYFERAQGAPGYNSGAIYGQLTLNKKTGNYEYLPVEEGDCKLEFIHAGNKIIIRTLSGDCGFGGGVIADGTYPLMDTKNPVFCITRTGKKVYFEKTPPGKFRED